jgi:hypothetical protein
VLFAGGGFVAGNVSPPVVLPAWERWLAAGRLPEPPPRTEPAPERLADTLARVRAQEERWSQRARGLQAEGDLKRRALHLMKAQGREPGAWPRLEAQAEQIRQDLDAVRQLLAEVAAVREGLEKLQDQSAAGPAGARELDDLEEIVIRARRLLEAQGP